jgi:photosystem II stability/assembly factor-like uncharacterized protein
MRWINLSLFLILVQSSIYCNGQFSIIPTGTDNTLNEIERNEAYVLVNGLQGYLARISLESGELTPLTTLNPFGYTQKGLHLIDADHYYLSSSKGFPHRGFIFESHDLGTTWHEIYDTTEMLFNNFVMFDSLHGCITSTFYRTINTANGGLSWNVYTDGLIGTSAIKRVNDSSAVMGITEKFRYTTDYGVNWSGSSFVQSVPRAYFAPKIDSIFAVTYGVTGVFFTYSLNLFEWGWNKKNIPDFEPFGLYVKSLEEVYITGRSHSTETCRVMKTTNLGLTWSFFDFGIEGALWDIEFIDDTYALISGTNGLLIKWDSNSDFEVAEMEEEEIGFSLSVYPNPTSEFQTLLVELDAPMNVEISLFNLNGERIKNVHSGNLKQGENQFDQDLKNLAAGIYYYHIQLSNGESFQEKFIKK